MTNRLLLLAVALLVAPFAGWDWASASEWRAEPAPGVVGVAWALTTLQAAGGQPEMVGGAGLTITFGMDGRVTGSGGCNQFSGTYSADLGGTLTLSPLAATRIGCAAPIADREARYFATLREAIGYTLDDGGATLRLTFAQGGRQLVYGRSTANLAQVTGTVTYRQRIALPADAVLSVQLVNVSRQDAPTTVLAEQVGPASGTVSQPYAFTLGYDPQQIVASNTYAVQARITVGGQVRFVSTQTHLVITQGRPTANLTVIVEPTDGGASSAPDGPVALPQGGGGGMASQSTVTMWPPTALGVAGLLLGLVMCLRRRTVDRGIR